jgi:hypothetical protein
MPSGTAPLVVLRLSPPPAAASVASPPGQQSGPHGRDFLRHLVHLAGPRGLPPRFVGRSNVETMGTFPCASSAVEPAVVGDPGYQEA